MDKKELEESLRESACDGDAENVTRLLQQGANVNSQNNMNGWTALHWAAKRGHASIVKCLVEQGADCNIRNAKNQTPVEVATSAEVVKFLGGDVSVLNTKPDEGLPITPNYLANPVFPYLKQSSQHGSAHASVVTSQTPHPHAMGEPRHSGYNGVAHNNEVVLKIRVANAQEKDFYEVELTTAQLTYDSLLALMCSELHVHRQLVQKIRKLPDTVVRKDKDVQRLRDFQELELVLSNKYISESSRNYTPSVTPRNEDIVY